MSISPVGGDTAHMGEYRGTGARMGEDPYVLTLKYLENAKVQMSNLSVRDDYWSSEEGSEWKVNGSESLENHSLPTTAIKRTTNLGSKTTPTYSLSEA